MGKGSGKGGFFKRTLALSVAALTAFGGLSPRQQAEVRVGTQSQKEKSSGGSAAQVPQAAVLDVRRIMTAFGRGEAYRGSGFIWQGKSHRGRSGGKRTRHDYRR